MSERNYGIGIDLGTSMSAISRVDISAGTFQFLEARDLAGNREVPSVVYFHEDGTMEFGEIAARRQYSSLEAGRVVTNVKLLLRDNAPLTLPGLDAPVEPKMIIRGLLAHLKKCFENTAKMPCTRAVVTVPAHADFDVDYRMAVREAVMMDEPLFESIGIVPEPDAVLLSIGDLRAFAGERVLVFDMGGGTLDVSIREVTVADDRPLLKQLAVTGSDAAGRRITESLGELLIRRRQEQQGFTYESSQLAVARVINFLAVDEAKRFLSGAARTQPGRAVACQLLSPDDRGTYTVNVQGPEFASLVAPVVDEARATVEKALSEAGCVASDIDRYFMVGGSSNLLQVEQMLREVFGGRAPNPLQGNFGNVDPTLAVVRGAAMDDLERLESSSVPQTLPILERKMPYAISMLVNGKLGTEVLVPKGATLPFGPVEQTMYLPKTGDTHIDLVLLRGEGHPTECETIAPRTVELFEPAVGGDELTISWLIEKSGELTLTALDHKNRELVTMRAGSIPKESN